MKALVSTGFRIPKTCDGFLSFAFLCPPFAPGGKQRFLVRVRVGGPTSRECHPDWRLRSWPGTFESSLAFDRPWALPRVHETAGLVQTWAVDERKVATVL